MGKQNSIPKSDSENDEKKPDKAIKELQSQSQTIIKP